MSDGTKDATTRKTPPPPSPEAKADLAKAEEGNGQVQAAVDEEHERGYRGAVPDPTPNEAYTVAGVVSGMPTPETDRDAAKAARESVDLDGRF